MIATPPRRASEAERFMARWMWTIPMALRTGAEHVLDTPLWSRFFGLRDGDSPAHANLPVRRSSRRRAAAAGTSASALPARVAEGRALAEQLRGR